LTTASAYPVTLAVDYPERQSRWKTLLRLFLAIPVLIFLAVLNGAPWPPRWGFVYSVGGTGAVVLAIWIAIVLRARIPHWLFDFQVALMRWEVRAGSYVALLTDTYPPFEGEYPVRLEVRYPERIARWKVLVWKAFTSLPHLLILVFLTIGAVFAVVASWFAILFTGRFPRSLHTYVSGVVRWSMRVQAYFLSLTDEYPPFSLSPNAGSASRDTYVVSSVIGWLLAGGLVALAVTVAILSRETVRVDVSYADLRAGRIASSETTVEMWGMDVALTGAVDPADEDFPLLIPEPGRRLVAFRLELNNESGHGKKVRESDFRLRDGDGKWHDPMLTFVGGRAAPVTIDKHTSAEAIILFDIGGDARPDELRYRPPFTEGKRVIYELE
jgi:hypothetical protein